MIEIEVADTAMTLYERRNDYNKGKGKCGGFPNFTIGVRRTSQVYLLVLELIGLHVPSHLSGENTLSSKRLRHTFKFPFHQVLIIAGWPEAM